MTWARLCATLIANMPEILKMLQHLEQLKENADTDRKIKEDLKKINEAFKNKDAELLRKIFDT
jgi:hypothetical protein